MKRLVFILFMCLIGFASRAVYRPLELYEMIIKAEKIVYGTITEVDSEYFTFKIDGSLTSDTGSLRIIKFQDWPCAARWTDYEIGQKLFLFLNTWNGELSSMSGGGEGELPIVGESVFIHGFSIPIPPPPPPPGRKEIRTSVSFETEHIEMYGDEYYGVEWGLIEFIETVRFVRNCFQFEYGEYRSRTNWVVNCDQEEIERMKTESKLVNWIHQVATRKEKRDNTE